MAQFVDASVIITLERTGRGFEDLRKVTDPDESLALAAVTASELLVGVHRAASPSQRFRRQASIEGLIERLTVFPFDLNAARIHARLAAELAAQGQMVGAHDLILAATALSNGYAVLTDNVREFTRVPGLEVRQPRWS